MPFNTSPHQRINLKRKGQTHFGAAALAAMILLVPGSIFAGPNDERALSLYNIHNKETISLIYKRNGVFVPEALEKLNWFARDWRRNEPTKMDPKLFDIIWELHTELGSEKPVHLISAYRSPGTNDMLRKTRGGQAKNSRHKVGMAMDVHFPDVPVKRLRYSAMIRGVGGVGYYPTSATPFVHVDTGNVRHWPRMPRAELALLFPNGKTQHRPPDGRPVGAHDAAIARQKYSQLAGEMDSWRMARLPLTGGNTMIASLNEAPSSASTAASPAAPALGATSIRVADRIPIPRVIGSGSTWDTQTIVASIAPPNTPLPSMEAPASQGRNPLASDGTSIAALIERSADVPQATPAVRPTGSKADLKLASLGNSVGLNQLSEPAISAGLIERQLRQDGSEADRLDDGRNAESNDWETATNNRPDSATNDAETASADGREDVAGNSLADEDQNSDDKDRAGLASLLRESISQVANWFSTSPDDTPNSSANGADGSMVVAINRPDDASNAAQSPGATNGISGSAARELRLAELTRIAGWTSAPEYDADHPEEFSYRAFPVGPLLTAEASIDDPILQQIVHPDLEAARAMLDPMEDVQVSTHFRPGIQIAGFAGWDRLNDRDVMDAVSRATQSEGRGRPVKTAQQ